MKIRKLMAIVMAGVMVMGFSGTVFAADTTVNQDSNEQTADTTVTWTNEPTYSVTIPSTIGGAALMNPESGLKVNATYNLAPDTSLIISLANSVLMQRTGDGDSATLTLVPIGEDGFAKVDSNLTWTVTGSGTAESASIYTTTAMPTKAGTYTGTITFDISYLDIS